MGVQIYTYWEDYGDLGNLGGLFIRPFSRICFIRYVGASMSLDMEARLKEF